ncbi:MAG: hypothetical protein K9K84_11885 [Methylovulum sp.]|jgi:hypothetical protein|nr:hypothetical protein [Methylovulum sp.]
MDTLNFYRHIREQSVQFSPKLFGQLDRSDLNNAGQLLWILKKNVLMFDDEGLGGTEMSHFSDFSIFDYYNAKGLNAVQRYWQQHGEQLSGIELQLIQASLKAQSSLFSVISVDSNKSTIKLQDLFDDNHQVEIIDVSMSKSPILKDCLIFMRVLTVDTCNMTSGVSFIFKKDKEEILKKKYKSMIKQAVSYTPQAKNFIVFLKLSHKLGIHTNTKSV